MPAFVNPVIGEREAQEYRFFQPLIDMPAVVSRFRDARFAGIQQLYRIFHRRCDGCCVLKTLRPIFESPVDNLL